MGTIAIESVISSAPFRFFVGPNRREFTVHSAAIANQSEPLRNLVHGDRTKANHVILDAVDELTFVLFCEYVYTGDYHLKIGAPRKVRDAGKREPEPEPERDILDDLFLPSAPATDKKERSSIWDDLDLPPAPVEELNLEDISPIVAKRVSKKTSKAMKKKKKSSISSDPMLMLGPVPEPEPEPEPQPQPPEPEPEPEPELKAISPAMSVHSLGQESLWNEFKRAEFLDSHHLPSSRPYKPTDCKSPGHTLLVHTKVYLLADSYKVTSLVSLSLDKLHQALVAFEVRRDTLEDIVRLLRFGFEEETPDLLRSLLSLFAACYIKDLWKSEGFRDLLKMYGHLSERVIGSLLSKIP